jgi:hypothetical protein
MSPKLGCPTFLWGSVGDGLGAFWEPIIHMSESLADIGEDRIREGRETVDIRWHIWIKEVSDRVCSRTFGNNQIHRRL